MDEAKYGELLRDLRPRIIETPEEHERLLSVAESLMEKGDELSEEEREALALVVLLIEAFEATVREDDDEDADEDDDEAPTPQGALTRLMQTHGIEINDIAPIFGNPHIAREVLDGKRAISHAQAKELGRYFRVPERLFRED